MSFPCLNNRVIYNPEPEIQFNIPSFTLFQYSDEFRELFSSTPLKRSYSCPELIYISNRNDSFDSENSERLSISLNSLFTSLESDYPLDNSFLPIDYSVDSVEPQEMANQQINHRCPEFSGSDASDSLIFMKKYEAYANVLQWDNDAKVLNFPMALTGQAFTEFIAQPDNVRQNWANIIAYMNNTYSSPSLQYSLTSSLMNRSMLDHETVDEYGKYISGQAHRIGMPNDLAVAKFISGLRPELQDVIAPFQPNTITEAVQKLRLHSLSKVPGSASNDGQTGGKMLNILTDLKQMMLKGVDYNKTGMDPKEEEIKRLKQEVENLASADERDEEIKELKKLISSKKREDSMERYRKKIRSKDSMSVEDLVDRFDKLEIKLLEQNKKVRVITDETLPNIATQQFGPPTVAISAPQQQPMATQQQQQYTPQPREMNVCQYCKKPNHTADKCYQIPGNKPRRFQGRPDNRNQRPRGTCYVCGASDHFVKDCPMKYGGQVNCTQQMQPVSQMQYGPPPQPIQQAQQMQPMQQPAQQMQQQQYQWVPVGNQPKN